MIELLLPILSTVLPDALKRILPDERMTEAERATLAQQLQLELMKHDWSQVEAEFKDRDSARNLAAQEIAKGNALTSAASALVRPMWGIGSFALVAYSVGFDYDISPVLEGIIQSVLMFYFGGRVLEKLAPTIMAGIGKK